jgi:methylated-DNA-protein-cysteine methyltransferase-like protein
MADKTYARIYRTVRRIPVGCVATYGQIAELAGLGQHARMVGYALAALPHESDVPWHRVINAKGEISHGDAIGGEMQRQLLVQEGVPFDATRKRVILAEARWRARKRVTTPRR